MNRVVVKIGIGAWIVSTAVIIITLFMLYVQCPEGSTLWIDGRGFGCGGDIGGMVGQMVTDRGMRWIGFISVPCAFILFIGYLLPEPNIRPIFNDRNLCQAGVAGACLGLITNNLLLIIRSLSIFNGFMYWFTWYLYVLAYAQQGCFAAGLVGLWFKQGRPRPWWLVLGIAGFFGPSLCLLFLNEFALSSNELLLLLLFTPYLANYGMLLRDKTFPKVAFIIESVALVLQGILIYTFLGSSHILPLDYNLWMVANTAMDLFPVLEWVVLQLHVVFWVITLRKPSPNLSIGI